MHMADPIGGRTLEVIERFVVLMYSRTSDLSRDNDARKQMFAQQSRSLKNIPPTTGYLGATPKACPLPVQLLEYVSVPRSTVARSF